MTENLMVCKAWVAASCDPKNGSKQQFKDFEDAVGEKYKEIKKEQEACDARQRGSNARLGMVAAPGNTPTTLTTTVQLRINVNTPHLSCAFSLPNLNAKQLSSRKRITVAARFAKTMMGLLLNVVKSMLWSSFLLRMRKNENETKNENKNVLSCHNNENKNDKKRKSFVVYN